jgi:hypothetical protein
MTACTHPEERRFAWTVYDPAAEGDYLCMGCTACGQILMGAVDEAGTPVGAQHRLSPKKKKSKKRRKAEKDVAG